MVNDPCFSSPLNFLLKIRDYRLFMTKNWGNLYFKYLIILFFLIKAIAIQTQRKNFKIKQINNK